MQRGERLRAKREEFSALLSALCSLLAEGWFTPAVSAICINQRSFDHD